MNNSDQHHAHGVSAGHRRRRERSTVSDGNAREASEQKPCARKEHGPRQTAARGEHTEAEDDLPQPRQHPEHVTPDVQQHKGQNRTRNARRQKLRNRHADHLICYPGMKPPAAREHLARDEGSAENGGAEPQRNILRRTICRLWDPVGLHHAGQQRENGRCRESQRTVAAKLRRLRYLAANIPYVDKRSVEVSHEHEIPLPKSLHFATQSVKEIYFCHDPSSSNDNAHRASPQCIRPRQSLPRAGIAPRARPHRRPRAPPRRLTQLPRPHDRTRPVQPQDATPSHPRLRRSRRGQSPSAPPSRASSPATASALSSFRTGSTARSSRSPASPHSAAPSTASSPPSASSRNPASSTRPQTSASKKPPHSHAPHSPHGTPSSSRAIFAPARLFSSRAPAASPSSLCKSPK